MFPLKIMGLTGKIALVMFIAGVGLQTTRWTTVSMAGANEIGQWDIVLVSENEPGEPLEVSGIVHDAQGVPLSGVKIEVHQTDTEGYYSQNGSETSAPRIRGTMTTDGQGRYRFRTIIPGAYPGEGPPAHIHFKIYFPGEAGKMYDLWFEGDERITDAMATAHRGKGLFSGIQPLSKGEDGLWHCRRDFKP